MNLEIWIDEADVGVVKPGQEATFEVSAYANRKFDAVVESIDISPTTTDNVVPYLALLLVDNEDGLLRPGMTATATVTTNKHEGVIRVPNAALRFDPDAGKEDDDDPALSFVPTRPGRRSGNGGKSETTRAVRGTVHIVRNGELEVVGVAVGATDGTYTAITTDALEPGDEVVVGVGVDDAAPTTEGGKS